jgi:hypothetical protein
VQVVIVVGCLRLVGLVDWVAFHTNMKAAAGTANRQLYTFDCSQRLHESYVYHCNHQDISEMVGSSSVVKAVRRHEEMKSSVEN